MEEAEEGRRCEETHREGVADVAEVGQGQDEET